LPAATSHSQILNIERCGLAGRHGPFPNPQHCVLWIGSSADVFQRRRCEALSEGMHVLLDPLLVAQHGVVARSQCFSSGLSGRQVQWLLDTGRLDAVFRGVYRDPAVPRTADQRAMAAVLAGGEGTLVSRRMAVAVWGMRNFRCTLAEVTSSRRIQRPGIVAYRDLVSDGTKLRGIPITTPARTLLDCSTIVSKATLGRFLENWLSTGMVRLDELENQLDKASPEAVARTRAALADRHIAALEPDSPTEGMLGEILVKSGLPQPVLHHVVIVSSGAEFELDWSYPDLRLAFELDGYGVHLRSLDAFEHDRYRRNELEIDGWTILNFTRRMVERRPESVVDQVRRLLAQNDARVLNREC
jgi:hypothetical protein